MGGGVQSREMAFETGDDLERGMTIADVARRAHDLLMDEVMQRANVAERLAELNADRLATNPNLRREIENERLAVEARMARFQRLDERRENQRQLERDYEAYAEEEERRNQSGRDTPPTMTERMDDNETDLFRQQESERRIMERLRGGLRAAGRGGRGGRGGGR